MNESLVLTWLLLSRIAVVAFELTLSFPLDRAHEPCTTPQPSPMVVVSPTVPVATSAPVKVLEKVTPDDPFGVPLAAADCADSFPAASTADTRIVYRVPFDFPASR